MNFNPQRLAIARRRNLLNKQSFASLIGVTPRTLVRWDNELAVPTSDNIDACARELNYPREFFFGSDISEPNLESTSFRSQTSMAASMRDAATAAGALGFLVADYVQQRFDLPPVSVPDLRLFDPESAARTLREEWCLGEQPISNMVHLLESKGVRVFSLAENTATVDAYALWRNEIPYVFLNTMKTPERSRFDAAHELGHLVLHQDGKVTGREAEEQANLFASSFLMPRADVTATFRRGSVHSLGMLVQGKRRWKVSVAALNYRCHKLGIISEWKNREFCIEIARKGYNKIEPAGIEREKSIVWEKVVKALWADKMSHADIAKELYLPIFEVEGLLFGMLKPTKATSCTLSEIPSFTVVSQDWKS